MTKESKNIRQMAADFPETVILCYAFANAEGSITGAMIQRFEHTGAGYAPLVLADGWQLARLNFTQAQLPSALTMLDRHVFTDEAFMLVRGRCVLIAYDEETRLAETLPMEWGVAYNIPRMTWHNIAMEEGSVALIAEGRDAHLKGCDRIPMPDAVRAQVLRCVERQWL